MTGPQAFAAALAPIPGPLVDWYRAHKRDLPWRENTDPYRVWVSEIMLQQTRVSAVVPYYLRFLQALPTVEALAACPEQQLLKLWEGLGYYSRARNLQKAARLIVEERGGAFPTTYEELLALPGVGPYTAGAIGSIALGLPCPAVDGNVLRVLSRLLCSHRDVGLPAVKKEFTAALEVVIPRHCPGDFTQALMELGAMVCLPGGQPLCGACPLADHCRALAQGQQGTLPVKTPKKAPRVEQHTVFLLWRGDAPAPEAALHQWPGGQLALKPPATGLLGGMCHPPMAPGHLAGPQARAALEQLGFGVAALVPLPPARHQFTHIRWELTGWAARVAGSGPPEYHWVTPAQLQTQLPVPTAFAGYLGPEALRLALEKLYPPGA